MGRRPPPEDLRSPLMPHGDDGSISNPALNSPVLSPASVASAWSEEKRTKHNKWRHTLGIALLLVTVVLWTASNFLASTIFADDEYSKPYFVTYINTAFFVIPLIPLLARRIHQDPSQMRSLTSFLQRRFRRYSRVAATDPAEEEDAFLKPDGAQRWSRSPSSSMLLSDDPSAAHLSRNTSSNSSGASSSSSSSGRLTLPETARLSLEFCILWFVANYFTAACLQYTTVASSTILTSTSSIWTLLAGSVIGVERFSARKLAGVLASLAGVALISGVDMSGQNDANRGSFPHKTRGEIAVGDALAVVSAILYGVYAVLMKKRIGDEGRVSMPLFFGLVGLLNVVVLWPGLVVLHLCGVETFELPPTGRVLTIVLVNSTSSLISDFCWAYAMLLTSPLVVTVGLSLTIPLSLIGQMVLESQYSSAMYWVGACVVFLSFIFINHEESKDEPVEGWPQRRASHSEADLATP